MIKCLRVDHRLLHGQVAFSWTSYLSADCILIANDAVMKDEIRKASIKLAKPQGVKLVIKNIEDSIKSINSGATDKYKLFIVVESVEDAYRLVQGTSCIKSINLGGTKAKEGTRNISKAINVLPSEEEMLKELTKDGYNIITIEDNSICGGFGSYVLMELSKLNFKGKFKALGYSDKFIPHGDIDLLYKDAGLDSKSIEKSVINIMNKGE